VTAVAGKKDIFKFTIQFSPGDPHHRQVAELLNGQGRRKAQFIVNAVLHYINCKETPEISMTAPLDYAAIEAVVMQILAQRLSQTKPEQAEQTHLPEEKMPIRKSDSIRFSEVSDALGQDGIEAIMSSLAAIQTKKNG
jgi:hypothetical protein